MSTHSYQEMASSTYRITGMMRRRANGLGEDARAVLRVARLRLGHVREELEPRGHGRVRHERAPGRAQRAAGAAGVAGRVGVVEAPARADARDDRHVLQARGLDLDDAPCRKNCGAPRGNDDPWPWLCAMQRRAT